MFSDAHCNHGGKNEMFEKITGHLSLLHSSLNTSLPTANTRGQFRKASFLPSGVEKK